MLNISAYLNRVKANGLAESSLYNIKWTLNKLNDFKALEEVTTIDIDDFFVSLQGKYSGNTINLFKIYIKQYFINNYMKEVVENIKIKPSMKSLDPDDILNIDDVNKMIIAADSHLYKALISVLFETGARISEILNISKKNDLTETVNGYLLKIYSKKTANRTNTPYRQMLLLDSTGYIRILLLYGENDKDKLFPISRVTPGIMLNKIAKKADITKPVNPHAFRHAHATQLVRDGIQESVIRKQLGWTGSSRMIDRYTHITNDDVINSQLKNANIVDENKEESELLKPDHTVLELKEEVDRLKLELLKNKQEEV